MRRILMVVVTAITLAILLKGALVGAFVAGFLNYLWLSWLDLLNQDTAEQRQIWACVGAISGTLIALKILLVVRDSSQHFLRRIRIF